MKAALYCRLSKEDENAGERESESIQNQKSMLIAYAREHGYEIHRVYCDEDYSGIDRDRPAFNQMIEDASRRAFDVILTKTQSRFTRDMELVEKYLHHKFIQWGIRFIAVVDHVDTADSTNKKSRQINGLINEWYLEDLSNNVRSVLTHKRRAGKYIASSALYGYRKDPADNSHLVPDPPAAEVVRRIFALYLAGNGTARIARLLNEEGIPSPTKYKREHGVERRLPPQARNGDLWGKATIHRMLINCTYTGDLEQGRHKKLSYKSHKTVWLPKSQWIVVPGTHEGIIDRETFQQVQNQLHLHARSSGGGRVHPLAGKVVCGLCGSLMEQTSSGAVQKNTGKPKRYFRCRMSQRASARCPGQAYLDSEQLCQLVLERLQSHLADWPSSALLTAAFSQRAARQQNVRQQELQRVKTEIHRREKAMQELYLDKSSGLIEPAQFARWNQNFSEERKRLNARAACLEQALGMEPDQEIQKAMEHLHAVMELKKLDRQLVCTLVKKIVVYPPEQGGDVRRIEIWWNF